MKSYIKYKDGSEVYIKNMEDSSMDLIFYTAAKMIAFNDCTDIEILNIVINSEEYFYAGWKPGMVYTFENKKGEEIWTDEFPEWDH